MGAEGGGSGAEKESFREQEIQGKRQTNAIEIIKSQTTRVEGKTRPRNHSEESAKKTRFQIEIIRQISGTAPIFIPIRATELAYNHP